MSRQQVPPNSTHDRWEAYGQEYARCAGPQQTALMEEISRNEEHPSTLEEKFFGALKAAAIDAYYTDCLAADRAEFEKRSGQSRTSTQAHAYRLRLSLSVSNKWSLDA